MDEVRLVDANSILKKLKSELDGIQRETNYPIGIADGVSFAIATIDTAPTIETQPVKRGMWVETHCDLICSVCKWEYIDELPYMSRNGYDSYYEAFAFCPHCGSRLSPPDGSVYEIEDFGGDADADS